MKEREHDVMNSGNANGDGAYNGSMKRLAINTVFLYIRQLLILVVSLYTSRVILKTLGAVDYGIYNVVGGFVTLFNVISGAFSVAIARFISYSLGKNNEGDMQSLYSTSLLVQIFVGFIVCSLILLAGFWYIPNKMVLSADRVNAALFVLVFSTASFWMNLINTPYNALLIAHERMKAFAYIGFLEAFVKLGEALLITVLPWDQLKLYGMATFFSTVIIRFAYIIYCKKHFPECKFSFHFNKNMFREMMSFTGWAFLGNGSVVLRDQGINMILNLFGGPVVNAARAIAVQVNAGVGSLLGNYIQAMQPQITKLHSSGQADKMQSLIYKSSKFATYLMVMICIPVIKNIDYILFLWLGEVPKYTNLFIIITLIDTSLQSLTMPMLYGILADGRIKRYEISLSLILVISVVLSYVFLSFGISIMFVYYFMLIPRILICILLLVEAKWLYQFNLNQWIREIFVRILVVTFVSIVFSCWINMEIGIDWLDFVLESIICVVITGISIWVFGITKQEKILLLDVIKNKMKSLHRN